MEPGSPAGGCGGGCLTANTSPKRGAGRKIEKRVWKEAQSHPPKASPSRPCLRPSNAVRWSGGGAGDPAERVAAPAAHPWPRGCDQGAGEGATTQPCCAAWPSGPLRTTPGRGNLQTYLPSMEPERLGGLEHNPLKAAGKDPQPGPGLICNYVSV